MNELIPIATPVSRLRQRLNDDMTMRHFSRETQRNYIRDVGRFATFLGRPPDTATSEDLRRFQVEQREDGMPVPTMNSIVAALRFFFTHTLDRPDLARRLVRIKQIRKLPVVLSRDEVARLLGAATCVKHQAALSVAYGRGRRPWTGAPPGIPAMRSASAFASASRRCSDGPRARPASPRSSCEGRPRSMRSSPSPWPPTT